MSIAERNERNTDLSRNHMAEQAKAIAGLPEGLAIIRMENENIMSLAAARPRNFEAIKADLEESLDAFPAQAAKLIYAKPVGTKKAQCRSCNAELMTRKGEAPPRVCPGCKSTDIDPGGMQFARGLSIRAAEMLAEVYGYNSVKSRVEDIDDRTARVVARFFDYQNGRWWEEEGLVSKYYTARNGGVTKIPDDRFWDVVVKGAASKRIREAILRCVNAGLKAWLYDKAEEKIDELLDDSTVTKIIGNFANKKVSQEMLERAVGRPLALGWTKEDRKQLVGMWAALESGDATIAELFESPDAPAALGAPKVKESALNQKLSSKGQKPEQTESSDAQESGDTAGEESQEPQGEHSDASEPSGDELVSLAIKRIMSAKNNREINKICDEVRETLPDRVHELTPACDHRKIELQEGK